MSWLSSKIKSAKKKASSVIGGDIGSLLDPTGQITGLFGDSSSSSSYSSSSSSSSSTTTDYTAILDEYQTQFTDFLADWEESQAAAAVAAAEAAAIEEAAAQQEYDVGKIEELSALRLQSEELATADVQEQMLMMEEQFRLRGITAGFEEDYEENAINERFTEYWSADNETTLMGLIDKYMGVVEMPEISSRIWSSGGQTIANPYASTDSGTYSILPVTRVDLDSELPETIAPIDLTPTDSALVGSGTISKYWG